MVDSFAVPSALESSLKADGARATTIMSHGGAHLSKKRKEALVETAKAMTQYGKGLTACDEGPGTIGDRFAKVGITNSEENRRLYRQMLFSVANGPEYLSGAILDPETVFQKNDGGVPFPELLSSRGIVPGVKPHLKVHWGPTSAAQLSTTASCVHSPKLAQEWVCDRSSLPRPVLELKVNGVPTLLRCPLLALESWTNLPHGTETLTWCLNFVTQRSPARPPAARGTFAVVALTRSQISSTSCLGSRTLQRQYHEFCLSGHSSLSWMQVAIELHTITTFALDDRTAMHRCTRCPGANPERLSCRGLTRLQCDARSTTKLVAGSQNGGARSSSARTATSRTWPFRRTWTT